MDAELLTEVKGVLNQVPLDNAAELLERHRKEGLDSVYVMEAVARELGRRYLSEELREHVSVAMREVEP